jgi:hypothetical protein
MRLAIIDVRDLRLIRNPARGRKRTSRGVNPETGHKDDGTKRYIGAAKDRIAGVVTPTCHP